MMQLAFFKDPDTFFEKAICWRTNSQYYHVELVFDGVVSWSARSANHPAVGFVKWTNPKNCDLITIPGDAAVVYKWCQSQVGKAYDWLGIMGFVVPFGEHDDSDLFCSEGCTKAGQQVGLFKGVRSWMTSPGKLYDLAVAIDAAK